MRTTSSVRAVQFLSLIHIFLILGTNKEKGRCVPGPEPGTGDSLCRGLSDLDMGQGQTGILQRSPHLAVLYHAEGGGNGGGGDALVGMTADTVDVYKRQKEGRESLTLHVYRENSPAVRFYQREGFAIRAAEREENTGREEYHMEWHRGGQHLPPRRGEP